MKEASLTKLGIQNAQYYAYHGVKKEERKLGGKYEVDLDMWYDATNANKSPWSCDSTIFLIAPK